VRPSAATALALALGAALAACGDDAQTLAPVLDTPAPGSEADPFAGLQEITIEAALAGEPEPLVSLTFQKGERLLLPGVPFAEGLVLHMHGRAAVGGEAAYGRTCAFDLVPGAPLPAPHLWFSRIVRWGDTGVPPSPRRTTGAAWSAAGSGVFVGGTDGPGGTPLTTIDRFDAASGSFVTVAEVTPRAGAVVAALPDGRALIVGGAGFYELVDPLAGDVTQRVARFDEPRLDLGETAAVTLSDGNVVVMGGRDPAPPDVTGDVWLFEAGAGGLTPRLLGATLTMPRAGHTLTRVSDDLGAPVLVVGGENGGGQPIAQAELYQPLGESFADPAVFAPVLGVPRSRHAAVRMPDGSVLVVGGVDGSGQAVRTLELFSFVGGFRAVGELSDASDAGLVDFSLTVLPDGRVLLAGGRETPGGPALDTAVIIRLDPIGGTLDVSATDRLSTPRAGHQAVLLCDGTVLLVGGTDVDAPAERYNPLAAGRR
jgi:hypothetical protein